MVAVAATERGLMLSALGYIWTAVYVAFFFRPHAARRYAALMITALGLGLLSARAPTDVSVWVAISAMVWLAVAILTRLNARLRAEAHTDGLTGLLNRTGFAVAAARQRAMAGRRGEPLALAVIDLDDFKSSTTAAATLPATACSSSSPGSGLHRCGRATCWHGSAATSSSCWSRGRRRMRSTAVLARLARAHPASWTAGAVLCSDEESLEQAIDRADARLYVAKQPRRNAADRDRRLTVR